MVESLDPVLRQISQGMYVPLSLSGYLCGLPSTYIHTVDDSKIASPVCFRARSTTKMPATWRPATCCTVAAISYVLTATDTFLQAFSQNKLRLAAR